MKNIRGFIVISFFTANVGSIVAQEISPSVLIKTETNGVNVYQSNGYESKPATVITTKTDTNNSVQDWTLEDCKYNLSIIESKMEVLLDLGDTKRAEIYKSQVEELKARILVLTPRK